MQVYSDLQAKMAAYQTAKTEVKEALSFAQTLRNSLLERIDIWNNFRDYVAARARICFSTLMSKRGYNGKLLLNYDKGTLGIVVSSQS